MSTPGLAADEPSVAAGRGGPGGARFDRVIGVATALAIVIGVARAFLDAWVCDDAFISFRYADNLAHGQGLAWNAGERVEGFTNFLWTVLLAPAAALGLDLVVVSEALGLASFLALLLVLVPLGRAPRAGPASLPIAVAVIALLHDVELWATGGLETMLFTALAAGSVLALFGGPRSARREIAGGALLALLALTRPEALVFAAVEIGAYAAVTLRARLPAGAALARVAGPVAAAWAGLTAFRLAYYGDWLPNTYYAKSAGLAYWSRGLVYLEVLLVQDHVLVLVLAVLAAAAVVAARRRRAEVDVAAVVLVLSALAYGLAVVRSGGDFMFARRLVPAAVFLVAACGRVLGRLPRAPQLGAGAALVIATLLPYPVIARWGEGGRYEGISDERSFYPPDAVALHRLQGEVLAEAFRDVPATFVIQGGLCMVAYYSHLPVVIEPNGLTDRTIARQPVGERGIVGHEKHVSDAYLEARRASFWITRWPKRGPARYNEVVLGDGAVVLLTIHYDEAVMSALARTKRASFTPIAEVLPDFEEHLATSDCAAAREALAHMDRYYFRGAEGAAPARDRAQRIVAGRCSAAP